MLSRECGFWTCFDVLTDFFCCFFFQFSSLPSVTRLVNLRRINLSCNQQWWDAGGYPSCSRARGRNSLWTHHWVVHFEMIPHEFQRVKCVYSTLLDEMSCEHVWGSSPKTNGFWACTGDNTTISQHSTARDRHHSQQLQLRIKPCHIHQQWLSQQQKLHSRVWQNPRGRSHEWASLRTPNSRTHQGGKQRFVVGEELGLHHNSVNNHLPIAPCTQRHHQAEVHVQRLLLFLERKNFVLRYKTSQLTGNKRHFIHSISGCLGAMFQYLVFR